ncbi:MULTISPECIES: hypothetical protein [unclassified Beijerinckia]|uniref:hypothetical protein n=1 Tax=unclassified Beijerinckia TaxID=2638183 RepID=UPI0008968514|nr:MULTISPECIES: hypothetical protein [unclassified Beijerinckia]MDH7796374.1 hypothetical protein [Beijerinckia sp. GAS462]SEC42374.1 hypothetical protein SAMN05443249_2657 [Beijerinckia sp. 28-YEA-48]
MFRAVSGRTVGDPAVVTTVFVAIYQDALSYKLNKPHAKWRSGFSNISDVMADARKEITGRIEIDYVRREEHAEAEGSGNLDQGA